MNSAWFRLTLGMVAAAMAWAELRAVDGSGPADRPLLSPIFTDNMVLQRGKPNAFWGWTQPGKEVSVSIGAASAKTLAGAGGRWQVAVAVPPPGGPYTVTVGGNGGVVLHNVLVGDVWLCSGQSNMEFALKDSARGAADGGAAKQPAVRLYHVAQTVGYAPLATPVGRWEECTPESAAGFSAVGYYFGRRLQQALGVPIGLIETAVGGSPAESWMSGPALERLGEFRKETAEVRRLAAQPGPRYGSFLMHWLEENDAGGKNAAWAAPDLSTADWREVRVPEDFTRRGDSTGSQVWWLRREFNLDRIPAGEAKLFLGEISKMDTTLVNGRWVGASSWAENPRAYALAPGILRPGRNVLAVRVFIHGNAGGFRSSAPTLRLQFADNSVMPLAGKWRMAQSVDAPAPRPQPLDLENYPTMPTVLYNGMIAPLAPLALSGAIWYQGEANTSRASQYRRLLPALIADWRSRFEQGDFPFYIVSLPAFMAHRSKPGSDGWAELREAQAETVRTVSHTGLAITIDTGEADNIHPKAKQVVGDRLAWWALAQHYHLNVPHAGPQFVALENLPGALKIHFQAIGGGLVARGDCLAGFAIAGADQVWHWADARIEGDAVIVSAAEVSAPVAVRYAWQANPEATLFNADGFPAAPFRTDDWPL